MGAWENHLVGIRENIIIEASRDASTAFEKAQVWIRAYLRADNVFSRSAALSVITGIQQTQ